METPDASTPFPAGAPDARASLATLDKSLDRHREPPLAELLARRGLGPYRGYAGMLEAIKRLAQAGARIEPLGHSVRGEPLVALGFGVERPGRFTRTSVVVAGLHPLEWIGVETALALAGRLVGKDLGDRSVLVVPVANPDGIAKVDRNLREGRRRFVRHNAHGVDLNRNFDARWGHRGLLARLAPSVFRAGTRAESEPEVSALAFALGKRRIDRALSLHSFGGAVLYPSSHSLRAPADAEEHRAWARRIAEAADDRPYRVVQGSWFAFGATMGGLELDWFHERHGALSLLVECSRGGFALRPSRALDPFAWFNPTAPHATATRLARSIEGFVTGARL